jgi:hypothetical protein
MTRINSRAYWIVSLVAPKKVQDRVKEYQCQSAENDGVDEAKDSYAIERFVCLDVVLLTQKDRTDCRSTNSNQSTETYHKVHQRESDSQTGYSQSAHTAPNKNAVVDIIERSSDTCDNCRQRIL